MVRARKKKQQNWRRLLVWGGGSCGVIVALLLIVILVAPPYRSTVGFQTLSDVVAYTERMPEMPPMDNTNMVRPDYTTFHRQQLRGTLRQKLATVLSWVGLYSPPTWTPSYFESLLKESTIRLQQHKVRKNIVYKVTPKAGTQLVVWGDVSGAFHSFVRGLQKLKELSIIDDGMRIVADDTYFVLMGDAISRSPYGMETLSLWMRLQEVNPDRCIYLRGNHEDNKYWHAFGMKDQLAIRAHMFDQKTLVSQVDDFFMHLPLALYLPVPKQSGHYVRLSHLGQERSKKLHEERYAHFLRAPQQGSIDRHQFSKSVMHAAEIHIDAIVRSEKKRHTFQATDGLRLMSSDQGATAWTVLSSPTLVQQHGLKFFHDAFAVLRVGNHSMQWSFTLHAQDVRDMNGFTTRSYQFFTGKEMSLNDIAHAEEVHREVQEEVPAASYPGSSVTVSRFERTPAKDDGRKSSNVILGRSTSPGQPFGTTNDSSNNALISNQLVQDTPQGVITRDARHPDSSRAARKSVNQGPFYDRQRRFPHQGTPELNSALAKQHQAQRDLNTAIEQLRHRKVVRRAPTPTRPPVHAGATRVISPTGNESISVTVTPPQAGAVDQSTVVSVSVKVPPSSGHTHAGTNRASEAVASVPSRKGPIVQPVIRTSQVHDVGSDVAATAERIEVLEQASSTDTSG